MKEKNMKTFCDLLYDRKIKFGIFLLWCSKHIFNSSFVYTFMIYNKWYDKQSKLRYIFTWIIKFIVSECCNEISHWYTRRVDYWWCVAVDCNNVSIYAFECDWSKWSLFEGKIEK